MAEPYGNNSVQVVPIRLEDVSRLEIHLQNSGALSALSFCDEKPAPAPTPEPTVEPTDEPFPTPSEEPPASSTAPVLDLKS